MANFKIAHSLTKDNEGGYVNDPTDKGGETLNGISRVHFPNLLLWTKLDAIKKGKTPSQINQYVKNDATMQTMIDEFYKSNFWDVLKLDYVNNQDVANELFDTGVNMGVKTAAKMLQEALNLCNRNGLNYPDVAVDGIISANGETIKTLNGKADTKAVYNTLNMLQGERYLNIMRSNKSQEKFWDGWIKRVVLK